MPLSNLYTRYECSIREYYIVIAIIHYFAVFLLTTSTALAVIAPLVLFCLMPNIIKLKKNGHNMVTSTTLWELLVLKIFVRS